MELQQLTPEAVDQEIRKAKERHRKGLEETGLHKLKLEAFETVKKYFTKEREKEWQMIQKGM